MLVTLFVSTITLLQPITPLHTYNSVENGIMVTVELDAGTDVAKLVLCDFEHNQISPPVSVTGGTHDLLSRVPAIKDLEEAALLQLIVDKKPTASPLVVQPLTSREVPIVEEALRPDGETTYIKIVGWEDEAAEDGLRTPFVSGWRLYEHQDALFDTSEGIILVELRPDVAPNTVWNFRKLSEGGFYQNTIFHRIVPMTSKGHPFVIQGGDPTATGSGGPGYWLPIENSDLPHDDGVLSMARASDPDSAGSQFFFCLSREGTARLDGQYCSFGETKEGKAVIRKIAATPLSDPASGRPQNPPLVHSISMIPATPIKFGALD